MVYKTSSANVFICSAEEASLIHKKASRIFCVEIGSSLRSNRDRTKQLRTTKLLAVQTNTRFAEIGNNQNNFRAARACSSFIKKNEMNFVNEVGRKTSRKTSKKEKTSKIQILKEF